jgi:hypothetical protein
MNNKKMLPPIETISPKDVASSIHLPPITVELLKERSLNNYGSIRSNARKLPSRDIMRQM